jgi:adenylate kinase family enzyme
VLVIGSGGAGKPTLARELAAATGLPLVHLDRLYWRPGWVPTPTDEWRDVVRHLVERDAWVIDGNFASTLRLRLEAADTAVFLDVPRARCLARIVRRRFRFHGRTRPDLTPGCPEHVDWEFVRWIWTYPSHRRPGVLALLREFERAGGRAIVLRTRGDVAAFLDAARTASPSDPAPLASPPVTRRRERDGL